MSTQPFSNLGMADDFFSVNLHTSSGNIGSNQNPVWIIDPPNGAVQDRYKFYKRCFAVVDFVDIKADNNFVTGEAICIRDLNNAQPNSFDSQNGYNNIIWLSRGINSNENVISSTNIQARQEATSTNFENITNYMSFTGATKLIPSGASFPYEKVNAFGEQRYTITKAENNTSIDAGAWGIKITYYFYRTN